MLQEQSSKEALLPENIQSPCNYANTLFSQYNKTLNLASSELGKVMSPLEFETSFCQILGVWESTEKIGKIALPERFLDKKYNFLNEEDFFRVFNVSLLQFPENNFISKLEVSTKHILNKLEKAVNDESIFINILNKESEVKNCVSLFVNKSIFSLGSDFFTDSFVGNSFLTKIARFFCRGTLHLNNINTSYIKRYAFESAYPLDMIKGFLNVTAKEKVIYSDLEKFADKIMKTYSILQTGNLSLYNKKYLQNSGSLELREQFSEMSLSIINCFKENKGELFKEYSNAARNIYNHIPENDFRTYSSTLKSATKAYFISSVEYKKFLYNINYFRLADKMEEDLRGFAQQLHDYPIASSELCRLSFVLSKDKLP